MTLKRFVIGALLILAVSVGPAKAEMVFTDLASDHPYYEAIQSLYQSGVISGYPDQTFRPEKPVNRAEALKIILLGSDVFVPELSPQEIFPDVVSEVWYAKFVAKAKNLGIVKGDDESGMFRPGDTINLAEILKIMVETGQHEIKSPSGNSYRDVEAGAWFAPYFDYAKATGLLEPDPEGNAEPSKPMTRGLMAELMFRIKKTPAAQEYGKASYYGGRFHGRTTASGDVFDASGFTAAHRTYPFGTWLKVTNTENSQSVTVKVNDRGPYGDSERIIDLSKAAFEAIAPLSRGVITVRIEKTSKLSEPFPAALLGSASLLNANPEDCPEKKNLRFLPVESFQSIRLDAEIPTLFLKDEVMMLKGEIQAPAETVTAFLVDPNGVNRPFSVPVIASRFTLPVSFPAEGSFDLGLILGNQGTSRVEPLYILSSLCLAETEGLSLSAPTAFKALNDSGNTAFEWEGGAYDFFQLIFVQGNEFKRYFLPGLSRFTPPVQDFIKFHEGPVTAFLRGGVLSQKSLVQTELMKWSPAATLPFYATLHHERVIESDQIQIESLPTNARPGETLTLSLLPKVSLRVEAAVILPKGEVEHVLLESDASAIKNHNNVEIFPPSSVPITLHYPFSGPGLYFIEINNAEGLAAINLPLYPEDSFPLLPNPTESKPRELADLGNDSALLRSAFLALTNQERRDHGKNALSLHPDLNRLAQMRADDMAEHNYFGHWDAAGRDVNALKKQVGFIPVIGENLAKEVSIEFAHYGLMRSAIHRESILNPDWTRVGFGISRHPDGTYIFVQLFSEDPVDLKNREALRQKILETINKNRQTPLGVASSLNSLAQTWSDRMATQNFFDFEDPEGASIFDAIKEAGIDAKAGAYIVGNTSFSGAIDQIAQNSALKNEAWKTAGIGITQDKLGVIKITLIYSE